MGYGIGLAGLASTAEAIDVTSNNIANAQTVGYKSGEYVFADAYFKAADAQAKDRVGMGSFRQSIRRTSSYGTVVNSQNVLDMAIAGPGMFMLAKDTLGTIPIESPSKFEYTRNGQFSTDSQNRIVNQNGLLLCGFPADESGNIISGAKSVLTLDQGPLGSKPTANSKLDLNLDNRLETLKTVFDHTNSTTFSQATSQTIYDQYGNGHILGMYYKKVQTQPLTLVDDGAGGFKFQATQAIPTANQAAFEQDRQQNRISTTFNNADSKIQNGQAFATNVQTIKGAALDPVGNTSGVGSNWDMRMADGTHLAVKMTRVANNVAVTTALTTTGGADLAAGSAKSAGLVAGDVFKVVYNGTTYTNSNFNSETTLTDVKNWVNTSVGSAVAEITFSSPTATLAFTAGAAAAASDEAMSRTNVATYAVDADRYAVYATIDGFPVGHDPSNADPTKKDANNNITLATGTYSEQMSIGTMAFIGGKSIDTLEKGTDGKPVDDNSTSFNIIANGGNNQVNYGRNNSQGDRGVLQFTVKSDNITALTAQGQTYANSQDGHTVSSLTGYSIDSNGKLIATYDNGETSVKGQLILAYFNNVEGLMPNGNNTFAATNKSGEPLLSFPGDGLMGQVRSKSLEQSNVDLTNELVKLMVLQRQYSAMSQATKTMAATIIDDTINIGR
jgi:flagellar hook-basal body protein